MEIFLSHGAEVNRTYAYNRIGALDFAVGTPSRGSWDVGNTIPSQPRVFRKLLQKGGELCQSVMKRLVEEDGELAVLIMSVQARNNAAQ